MFSHLLKIQFTMVLLVGIGGYVLGSSLGDIYIITASILGASTAFIVVDRLKWINLSGWVANVVLLFVLFYSMQNFIGGGSTAKLVAVANLLAYLQITLVFQKKTPRLCWQILVLGILQMIVAAIFNLNFEYGMLFMLYFVVTTIALILQVDYQEWMRTKKENEKNLAKLEQGKWIPTSTNQPVVTSNLRPSANLASYSWLLIPWVLSCSVFAFILFHSLPHQRQEWQGPNNRKYVATGKSREVNLNIDGVVPQSSSLIFRARFIDPNNDENFVLNNAPYFRGMAMNRWSINDNATSWEAPYDHVFNWSSYLSLRRFKHSQATLGNINRVKLEVIVEPVSDPLLFATMPAYKPTSYKTDVEFCRDLSALTRQRSEKVNDIASYKFDVVTLVDENNRTLDGWPYIQFRNNDHFVEMEEDSPEHQLLTDFDSERYPQLVKIASQIANENPSASRLKLCDLFVNHFSTSNRYGYTLDYSNVERDQSLDPVEDFVANHRQGHCEFYASALTLMLRAQGIPARYVVGFHGGDYNKLTDCYVIHGRHAHAWVEAYIPPKECTQEMFAKSIAGEGGAWITLDPTPAIDSGQSNEALDLARSIWQDYVISPDHNKQRYNGANGLLMASTNDSNIGLAVRQAVDGVKSNRYIQVGLISITSLLMILVAFNNRLRSNRKKVHRAKRRAGKGLIANAISFVSPKLSNWISGTPTEIAFYARLEQVIKRRLGLNRRPTQTQREFALEAVELMGDRSENDDSKVTFKSVLENVTNAFYQARFGSTPLDKTAVEAIENQIKKLDQVLKNDS